PMLVADVEYADAGVLICREDQLGADERARPVLMDVVRAEVTALALVIGLSGLLKRRDADRIGFHAVVEHPDMLDAVLLVIEHRFVEHDQQIAVRQRQAIVGAAAERRRAVAVPNPSPGGAGPRL